MLSVSAILEMRLGKIMVTLVVAWSTCTFLASVDVTAHPGLIRGVCVYISAYVCGVRLCIHACACVRVCMYSCVCVRLFAPTQDQRMGFMALPLFRSEREFELTRSFTQSMRGIDPPHCAHAPCNRTPGNLPRPRSIRSRYHGSNGEDEVMV